MNLVGGFTLTIELIGRHGGNAILDSPKASNEHMRKKRSLGVATVLLRAHDMVDVVKIILPSPATATRAQRADDWGQNWLASLCTAVEL